jgi:hypothetical protein
MRSSLPASSLPPRAPRTSLRDADAALAEAFGTSDVLVPPPPEEGAIPEWHLATGVKPLRPLPHDLAETVRHRRSAPVTAPPPSKTGPRARRLRPRTAPPKLPTRRAVKPRGWVGRALAMLVSAVVLGTVAGALIEFVTRTMRGG